MNLVFLYGPHAAGKYTVGSALAELTGYHFFHNQLTVDAVVSIFPETGELRSEFLRKLRFTMIDGAAREGRSTIFTFAYSGAAGCC